MGEHLLSLLHIQKLGHSIEEIRIRALSSVISKYNLNLVDENNLENIRLLLEKLLEWFTFDQYSEEEKVLNLLIRILNNKNVELMLQDIDTAHLLKKLDDIECKIKVKNLPLLNNVKELIRKCEIGSNQNYDNYYYFGIGENKYYCNSNAFIKTNKSKNLVALKSTFFDSDHKHSEASETYSSETIIRVTKPEEKIPIFKVEYFPWQSLITMDKKVITSVYNGLRYIDNKQLIYQSCLFYSQVILRDFPAEVFLQRPLLFRTFLQLFESGEQDVRIPVIKSLIQTVQCLKESIKFVLNASVFNLKEEYYSVSAFPPNSNEAGFDNITSPKTLDAALGEDDCQSNYEHSSGDHNLKKYQLSVPQFCFEILLQALPHLAKKKNQEEINSLITLIYEVLTVVIFNLKSDIWTEQEELKSTFYKIFGALLEVLKFQKGKNQIVYITTLNITIKILNALKPPTQLELGEILPRDLHIELGTCISNYSLVLMFSQLHTNILQYVKQFPGQREKEALQEYNDVLLILDSMKSTVAFLKKSGKMRTKMEVLECIEKSLRSLDFHQNFDFINNFVNNCLLKWNKKNLKPKELKVRDRILLKLLASGNSMVKIKIYKKISDIAAKLLSEEEATNPKFEFPGDKMEFLFDRDVLTEIICHGRNSTVPDVRKFSSEVLALLLKSKFQMSETCWNNFMKALIPCLSLLQCFSEKSSELGRCIIKIFDPDLASSIGLSLLEVLKGNIRLLFSKNNLVRDEGLSRLFWLLSKENCSNKKLPRMSVVIGLNLSGICSSVKPKEFVSTRQSFYAPGKLSEVLEMLTAESAEPGIRRSALSQISVMMDDTHLHQTFLDQKGLEAILKIFNNCLIEKEFQNYPDSVIPIIYILRVLCLHNVCIRHELSLEIDIYYNILRGLFLFSSDDSMRQNATELLCLLLYKDCILRVPPEKSIKSSLSFPEVVVTKMCLPFLTNVHWRNSKHSEPTLRKTYMAKYCYSKLIRLCWAIGWVGSLNELFSIHSAEVKEKAHSPGIPDDLKISYDDIQSLKACSFGSSVKDILSNIQNATTHEVVFTSLHKLHSYFLLYNVDKGTHGKKCNDVGNDTILSHMLWESTLERFMAFSPTSGEDEALLLEVIRFVMLLLSSFKSERLINWSTKFLTDDYQVFPKILKNSGTDHTGIERFELRLAMIDLTQEVVISTATLDFNRWFPVMKLLCNNLKLEDKEEFGSVSYIDWLMSLLVDLTGKFNWSTADKTEYLENLITKTMEIIIAFHCTKDSAISFMGLNIIKNSLLVLNHILSDLYSNMEGWENLYYRALTKVVGHTKNPNYCWLLSLLFMREPIVRAAAFQLFLGFSNTPQSCELLLDQLNIVFEHLWTHGFKVLFDENECSFVKEKSVLLLSNLVSRKTKTPFNSLFGYLQKINFYQETVKVISNFQSEISLSQATLHDNRNTFAGAPITTPSLLASICILLHSIISFSPLEATQRFLENGIIESLTRVIGNVPETTNTCTKHSDCVDLLEMYIAICGVLTRSVTISWYVHAFMLKSPSTINNFFCMMDYNLYCNESKAITSLKTDLWCEVLDFFSTLLMVDPEAKVVDKENNGFVAINACMMENGSDNFLSTLYIALTSSDPDLRSAVLYFFINLFSHEMDSKKTISISNMFEKTVSSNALKLAMHYGCKGFQISETLTKKFGIRSIDILLQIFRLSSGCGTQSFRITVTDALGSLLAVYQPAQDFCIDKGLNEMIVLSVEQICVKLNLENVDNFKKPSCRRKVDPFLVELENLFRLLANLTCGNEKAKSSIADCSLTTVVLKVWPWCVIKQSLLVVTLKMLCTFTHFCDQACRTMATACSITSLGYKKPRYQTLLNAVTNQVTLEMDLISKNHNSRVLCLCLQLLSNCCSVSECRSILAKGNFIHSFTKIGNNGKKKQYNEKVLDAWLKFLIVFSSHQEGQLTLTKGDELLDFLMQMAQISEPKIRIQYWYVLRNICFHQLNRLRMLNSPAFLSMMFQTLDSDRREFLQLILVIIWSLSCNSQKTKMLLRTAGFETKLETLKNSCRLNGDLETLKLTDSVLEILRNK